MTITKELFGYTNDKQAVWLYRLTNANGAYVEIMNYGCRIKSVVVPDKRGSLQDVCLGYATLAEYETDDAYFGACIGRCTNLIANAQFALNGTVYMLDKNSGDHHSHGGKNGFSFCVWDTVSTDKALVFSRTFPHLHDGYPGDLTMQVAYEWTEENQLVIRYEGLSTQDTILNVTNHTYFNLNGAPYPSVLNHTLLVNADAITEIDAQLIPTGHYIPVEESPFDFRKPKTISTDIGAAHPQLLYGGGYDHNFVLNGTGFRRCAVLCSPTTGIRLICCTDQPGMQIYTANDLTARDGKYGEILSEHSGLCLETQHFTNAANLPHFPSVELKKNQPFRSITSFSFDITY